MSFPQIRLLSWDKIPEDHPVGIRIGQTGFRLVNDGGTAYDVLIEDFEVESDVWFSCDSLASIGPASSEFCLTHRKNASPFATDTNKWDLLGHMEHASLRTGSPLYQRDYVVRIQVVYRDHAEVWFRSEADLVFIPAQRRLKFGPTIHINSVAQISGPPAASAPNLEKFDENGNAVATFHSVVDDVEQTHQLDPSSFWVPDSRMDSIHLDRVYFQYSYGADVPAESQRQIESLRREADQRLQSKPINSFDERSEAKRVWLTELASGAAAVFGKVAAAKTWTADHARHTLKDFTMKAASATGMTVPALRRFLESEDWKSLDDLLFWPQGVQLEHTEQAARTSRDESVIESKTATSARTRVPDVEKSRARLALLECLLTELLAVKQTLKGYCTTSQLKNKYPEFKIWKYLEDSEVRELVDGVPFLPLHYAKTLVLRAFNITSTETLKKDRRKVKDADEQNDSR